MHSTSLCHLKKKPKNQDEEKEMQDIVAECRKKITSPYKLSVLAAKRARQLQMGAPPMVENKFKNYTNIALLEIAKGKVTFENILDLDKTIDLRKLDAKLITFRSEERDDDLMPEAIEIVETDEMEKPKIPLEEIDI
jgi:DNA-directed RNA polymerase subunit omega